jgi:outer membrane biosynthesis protein TonB
MRAVAVLAAALLLTGCSWVQKELPWSAPSPPPISTPGVPPKPTEPAPRPPRPKPRVEHPAPAPAAPPAEQTQTEPQAAPVVDYEARCRAMAANRAGDARDLGASAADQAKVQSDTYRDCMVQSK